MEDKVKKVDQKDGKRASTLVNNVLLPALAVFTGLLAGAVIIAITNVAALTAWSHFFQSPLNALSATWNAVAKAYGALFLGAIGNPKEIVAAFQNYFATGQTAQLYKAIYPFTESLVTSTPYIFAGLSVALGFRCGLFNIGAEGQFYVGALGSCFIGYSITTLPWYIHLPLALLGGAVAGGIWGAIPGYLKARFGAYEVVNTIMMNYIAILLTDWLLEGPMKASGYRPVTPTISDHSAIATLFPCTFEI